MISDKMQEAFNGQVSAEYSSAFHYLALSAHFEATDFRGFAHWMRIQYQEELVHAEKIYDFINERDGRVQLGPIEAPRAEWGTPLQAFEAALANEQQLSGRINELVALALEEKDFASHNFLQWFVQEQVEEEMIVRDIVQDLRRIGDNNNGLFLLDRDLAGRKPQAGEEAV